jgi:hypothetical protein
MYLGDMSAKNFNLDDIERISEVPACRGPEVLAILVEIDPVEDSEKNYPERVEKFSRNYIWRKISGDVTLEFIEAAIDRMFNADEFTSVVDLAKLREVKRRIVNLFLPSS